MSMELTTADVRRRLDALAGNQPADPIVYAQLARPVRRASAVPQPSVPPLSPFALPAVELAVRQAAERVVERQLRAARTHMRKELNGMAPRLD
jgi:hypothetical protein